jgi:outer membrane lipoprotein-sorting protein
MHAALRPTFHRAFAVFSLCLALLQPAISLGGALAASSALPAATNGSAELATEWNIDQLMQSLATAKPGRATFVEKKYMAILDRPVESSGELHYTPPDRLEKRTIKPKPETMLVEGGVLTVERGNQKHTLQLSEYPELAGLIDSIRGTLAGDRKALERSYKLKLQGDAERWTLSLFPTDPKMATSVHLIRIAGSRDDVRRIEVIQTDGDRSLMTINRVVSQ